MADLSNKYMAEGLKLRKAAQAAEERASKARQKFEAWKAECLARMAEEETEGLRTPRVTVTRYTEIFPQFEDFDAAWKYIRRNNAPELLHRRLSARACRDYVEAGKKIPGLKWFEKTNLRMTEHKGK